MAYKPPSVVRSRMKRSGPTCSIKRGKWCMAMANMLAETTGKVGFDKFILFAPSTLKTLLLGLRYKPTARSPGIMMNMCPWCGGDLKSEIEKQAKLAAKERAQEVRKEAKRGLAAPKRR